MKGFRQVFVFIKAYIKSMRLYYSFITGIAGLIGICYYQYLAYFNKYGRGVSVYQPTPPEKFIQILVILFLSWGINQIYNDYLGKNEDQINAPDRPMVTGEIHPLYAVLLSSILMVCALFFTWFCLEPFAVIPLMLGIALNFIYEYAKGFGIWGNIIFGFMISMCAVYGFFAAGKFDSSIFSYGSLFLIIFISLLNGLMTLYTYFKDYEGDKAVGKKTLVVKLGTERSQKLALFSSFLPLISFLIIYYGLEAWHYELNSIFIELGLLSTGLQLWTGYLYFQYPCGSKTYFSLSINFRACACSESAMIAIFNPALGIILFLTSYFFIGFLFNFHANVKG
jgi:geranylgeranylglycerol-phosphate geranylgeranyltransferase